MSLDWYFRRYKSNERRFLDSGPCPDLVGSTIGEAYQKIAAMHPWPADECVSTQKDMPVLSYRVVTWTLGGLYVKAFYGPGKRDFVSIVSQSWSDVSPEEELGRLFTVSPLMTPAILGPTLPV